MINQKWFVKNNKTLMGVTYCPEKIYAAALLLPGFGMHMCDVDYFMSKLARRLYAAGVYVLLLEPYGHGDSYGDLQDCTISSLIEDIMIGVEHCRTVSNNIYCFSRGLIANLLVNTASDIKIIGLSPVCVNKDSISGFDIPNDSVEICKYIPGDDYVAYSDFDKDKLCLIEMIGGRIRHIHGQFINPDILNYILTCNHMQTLREHDNAHWIFFESDDGKLYKIYNNNELKYRELSSYFKTAIYRDALWQHYVIDEIVKMIIA